MLPTSYRGSATIEGEHVEAVLRLDDGHVRLAATTGHHSAELLRWPIAGLEVVTTEDGDYLLQAGAESFTFAPQIDDGLGHEIALRAKFATADPDHVDFDEPAPHTDLETPVIAMTVAERIKENRHVSRRTGVLTGADLGVRTATIVMAVLALVVTSVAVFSGRLGSGPQVVSVEEPLITTPDSLPFTEATTATTVPESPATTTPAPPTTLPATPATTAPAPATTVPPTTAPTTTTVAPAPTPTSAALFDLTPQEAVTRWNSLAGELGTGLTASEVVVGSDAFSFDVGAHVSVSGSADGDGQVSRIEFSGDPSGTVSDDRAVLTALGMTVALVEPSLEPQWRRDLLAELGFDVDNPVLEGLDDSLVYEGVTYAIRWDDDSMRLVFSASAP